MLTYTESRIPRFEKSYAQCCILVFSAGHRDFARAADAGGRCTGSDASVGDAADKAASRGDKGGRQRRTGLPAYLPACLPACLSLGDLPDSDDGCSRRTTMIRVLAEGATHPA